MLDPIPIITAGLLELDGSRLGVVVPALAASFLASLEALCAPSGAIWPFVLPQSPPGGNKKNSLLNSGILEGMVVLEMSPEDPR